MGVFVFLPLVLPLTAWPVARIAAHRLHPRMATWLLVGFSGALAVCSTLSLGLLMVVGTAQLPGNPLPDGWSDPEVRAAVPYDEVAGLLAVPALGVVVLSCADAVRRHLRVRRRASRALAGMPLRSVVALPDSTPYAYALPGKKGRVVVTTALLGALSGPERRALFAHERAHLTARHHRFLLAARLAARANPFLLPLRTAVAYTTERWADEDAATRIGSRRTVARAVGKASLVSRDTAFAGFASAGPVPRRVAALLAPAPATRRWPSVFTAAGLATWGAAAATTVSALSSANSAVSLYLILEAATPL
ncbi:M56 family metallopeptidase [Streptomyces sp. NPDC017868]|uniref:M56 family metallopeptidase n=1 Tax=Streptomyces sp. NPDC017868 TaxID=3365014 RepID=UPI0037BBCF69